MENGNSDEHVDVVIIGGSLAGLMQGVMLKSFGRNVHILEQANTARVGYAAGIMAGPQVQEFLKKYDLTKQDYGIDADGIKFLNKDASVKRIIKKPYTLTSWSLLYYRLRANFDGLESQFVQKSPQAPESHGRGIYQAGKQVVDVEYLKGRVNVKYQDVTTRKEGILSVDLVIAADGSNSLIRRMMMPEVQRPYAGYIAWRGTVPQEDVSKATIQFFSNKLTTFISSAPKSYLLHYNIPGEQRGGLELGSQTHNWIWYWNVPDQSQLRDILTDVDGIPHNNTVPIGKLRHDIWKKQLEIGQNLLPAPFIDLLENTKQPFVSSISDTLSTKATFFDGKLLLVGDGLSLFRPHVGLSTNQAALHCELLEKVIRGNMNVYQWETEVLRYAASTRMYSRVLGNYGQASLLTFLTSVVKYLILIVGQKVSMLFPKFY